MTVPTDRFGRILLDAFYEGVGPLPVTECETSEPQDFAEHKARAVSGADMEHTGADALRGSMTIIFDADLADFGGEALFPERWNAFRSAIKRKPIGQLTHPTHGLITAAIKVISTRAHADNRGGVECRVEWVEHNASAADLTLFSTRAQSVDSADAAVAKATETDAAVEAALASVGG
jgi:prophage DNA circulation protein